MAEKERCPSCGQELPANTPRQLCPECLLRHGMESEAATWSARAELEPTTLSNERAPVEARPILEGPGSRIGPYKLLQEIGEGGMGVVYMAEQEKPVRRRVALKIIKPGMDTSQVIARFEAERQALALMDHQHIAKVLDAGATDTGRPYFVMELVRGVPITEYCDRNQLTPKERLELFVPVCNAIQHAHQKGIIHRDIKPSNVLVTLYDGRPVAKVIDFGVAKATDQRLTERTMFTQFGQVIGTLEYMSPEQAEMGALDIDSRSDIYSLGVVLYELLTGSTPLQRAKLRQVAYVEILRRIREDETPKPSTRLSDSKDSLATISAQRKMEPARLARLVRGELDWIVMRALEKDRVRRYDTANALAHDIQRYLGGDPVEAGPPSATYRLRKFARKYRPWLLTAASFAAMLLSATAVSVWQAFRATRAERLAHAERNRAVDAEKVAKEQSERALAAERTTRGERDNADAARKLAQSASDEITKLYAELTNQARFDINAGKYSEAKKSFARVLEGYRRLFGEEHPATASAMDNLGLVLHAQAKYAEAEALFRNALATRLKALPPGHIAIATSHNSLASNLNAQGKYVEAQSSYEKALAIYLKALPPDHPDIAAIYRNFARNLSDQGKYAEAEPLFEKALEINRRVFADDHPETAASYDNLALNLDAQNEHSQAQPLHEKALEIRRRVLGDDHPGTATSYNHLATNLDAQGKCTLAQPLFEKALEINRRVFADDHPNTAETYNNLGLNLDAQNKHSQAQPLHEKALELRRRLLTEDHPDTATSYNNLANNFDAQGNYAQAQPLHERALEIRRRRLTEEHPDTVTGYDKLAANLGAQGKYAEARDQWQRAVSARDAARRRVAFTGMERAGMLRSMRPALAALQARLGQPAEAWQALEQNLGRGLLDELDARQDRRLAPTERTRLSELTTALERLDRLVESKPHGLDQGERLKWFEELKRQRDLASIALGEFQTKLVEVHGPLAGRVARLDEIQAALPPDAALVAWVDIPPLGPNAADPDGEHWGVVVRSSGIPAWIPIEGSGKDGLWTSGDTALAGRVRTELRTRPGASRAELPRLVEKLRTQRLAPLAKALGATSDSQPPARRLIVLPSREMAGIPVEALLAPDDTRTVSYAPSATVFKYLREPPRADRHAGLLALGDPVYDRPDKSNHPNPLPDHGLLVNVVIPGSNAAMHGLKPGDVLVTYNGMALKKMDDLKVVDVGQKPIGIEVWSDGRVSRRDLAAGKMGAVIDPRPAPVAITEQRKLRQSFGELRESAEEFRPLPGTRYEVEALARLFKSDDRPTRILLAADASEPELDRLATSGQLGTFGFIHLAAHGVVDESVPTRSAVILTQTDLPDPLQQVLNHRPVFDGRLSVREIQRGWNLKAALVTLSANETALGRESGGEGDVGFTQALLMLGTRSVCLSLWNVDDSATSLLMRRFYENVLGKRGGLARPLPKAEALSEAKKWLQCLDESEAENALEDVGLTRDAERRVKLTLADDRRRPYAHPYYWAAFVLVGDPD